MSHTYNCTECGRYLGEYSDIPFKSSTGILTFKAFCGAGCQRKYAEHNPGKSKGKEPSAPQTAEQLMAQAELERARHEIEKQERAEQDRKNREFIADAKKYWKIWVPIAVIAIGWFIYHNYNSTPAVSNVNTEQEWKQLASSFVDKPSAPVDDNKREQVIASENTTQAVDKPISKNESVQESDVNTTTTGVVIVDQANFYAEPDLQTKRKAYLIKNQEVTVSKSEGDFIYCSYTNSEGKKTEGWMLKGEIE